MSRYEEQFDRAMERQERSRLSGIRWRTVAFRVTVFVVVIDGLFSTLIGLTPTRDWILLLPSTALAFLVAMFYGRWAKRKLQKLEETAHISEQAGANHEATAEPKKPQHRRKHKKAA